MAGTDRRVTNSGGSVGVTQEELNSLIDQFDALLAKLDADAGVGDTDYVAVIDDGSYSKVNP